MLQGGAPISSKHWAVPESYYAAKSKVAPAPPAQLVSTHAAAAAAASKCPCCGQLMPSSELKLHLPSPANGSTKSALETADLKDVPTDVVTQVAHKTTTRPMIEKKSFTKVRGVTLEHDPQYHWLQGEVRYTEVGGGGWLLRYLPIDKADQFDGIVVLARSPAVERLRDGDVVKVDGKLLPERSSLHLGAAIYRVNRLTLIKAADGRH